MYGENTNTVAIPTYRVNLYHVIKIHTLYVAGTLLDKASARVEYLQGYRIVRVQLLQQLDLLQSMVPVRFLILQLLHSEYIFDPLLV